MQLEEARKKIAKHEDMVAGFEAQLSTPDAAKQLVLLKLLAALQQKLGALRQQVTAYVLEQLRLASSAGKVRDRRGGYRQGEQDGGRGESRIGWGRATRGCPPAVLLLPLLGSSPW